MKKILILILVFIPCAIMILLPIEVGASSSTQEISIGFIDNPNLPRAPAPGIAPGANSTILGSIGVELPKTGDSPSNLFMLGLSLITIACTLFCSKKKKSFLIDHLKVKKTPRIERK